MHIYAVIISCIDANLYIALQVQKKYLQEI